MGALLSWIGENQFTINRGAMLQITLLLKISDAELLKMWKGGILAIRESGRC